MIVESDCCQMSMVMMDSAEQQQHTLRSSISVVDGDGGGWDYVDDN